MTIAVRLVPVGIPTLEAIAKDKDGNDVGIADLSCSRCKWLMTALEGDHSCVYGPGKRCDTASEGE
jgi:hypothetical protein